MWRGKLAQVLGSNIAEIAEPDVEYPGQFQLDDRTSVRWSGESWQVQAYDKEGKETVSWVPFGNLIQLVNLIG